MVLMKEESIKVQEGLFGKLYLKESKVVQMGLFTGLNLKENP